MEACEAVTQKCPHCKRVADGFLLPDATFVCPHCVHPAVFERWQNEWRPIEKKRLKEQDAKRKLEESLIRAEQARIKKEEQLRIKVERDKQTGLEARKKSLENLKDFPAKKKSNKLLFAWLIPVVFGILAYLVFASPGDKGSGVGPALIITIALSFHIGFALLTCSIMEEKGHSSKGWFLMSFLFSGLIFIIALCIPKRVAEDKSVDRFACPDCGELIPVAANVCRFCKCDLRFNK